MRSTLLLSLITALWLSSCSQEEKKELPPANLMSEEQFVDVLADFALAESASNLNIKNAPFNKTDSVYAFSPLRDHNARKTQYDSTVRYYTNHPELYTKIYERVLARLSELESQHRARADSAAK